MIDIAPELIEKIEADFKKRMNMSEPIKDLFLKIKSGTATYKDAQNYAVKVSEIMSETLNRHLSSDILPDGRLYYNIAKRIFNQTLGENGTYGYISQYAKQVQGIINKNAGIGIKAIKADINQDRIDGIVDIVSGKEKFDDIKYMVKEPIINYGQAIVDDTVRVNIDFHGKAGLKPKVVRTSANPCQWCGKLQGVYEYPDVPKDVYRRHRHCRCLVTYEEGGKRPENVHTKRFATPEELEHRKTIGLETPLKRGPILIDPKNNSVQNVMAEYLRRATPGVGKIEYEKGYEPSKHQNEISVAEWIHKTFGGNIVLLNELNKTGIQWEKTPDYLWNGKCWELKNTTTEKAADSALRSGLKQIQGNPGGIILDYKENSFNRDKLFRIIENRIIRNRIPEVDIMILSKGELYKILRYKK